MDRIKHLGHYFLPVYPWLLVGASALALTSPRNGMLLFAEWLLTIAMFALLITGAVHSRRSMCTRCAEGMPLDGKETAERYRGWLKITHLVLDRRKGYILFVGVACVLAAPILSLVFRLSMEMRHVISIISFDIPMGLLLFAQYRHEQVRPWCPWCHWHDKGPKEHPVVPDPSPASQ